jgi:hypothetical protein
MKRILIIIGVSLMSLFICSIFALYIWTGHEVKENINIAKKQHPGIAEDALIAYLLDTNNSTQNRSNIAIWTLGQIESKKALPILRALYKNDPEGKTCFGKHKSVLCQKNLRTAIRACEANGIPWHRRLNK